MSNKYNISIYLILSIMLSIACGGGSSGSSIVGTGISGTGGDTTPPSSYIATTTLSKAEDTIISGSLLDVITGSLMSNVQLSISGTHAKNVVDGSGEAATAWEATQGIFALYLAGVTPSADTPVKFTVIAYKKGYLSTSKEIYLTSQGAHEFNINMFNLNSAQSIPDIAVATATGSSVNGVLQSAINLNSSIDTTASSGNAIKASANLSIPAGTTITNRDGVPLTGALSITTTYHNSLTDTGLSSFPGGLEPTVTQNGTQSEGYFVSAGFTAIEVSDENGNKARNFSTPFDLRVTIAADTVNPNTGAKVQVGETLPLWSYDEDNAQWTLESNAIVKGPDSNGLLYVEESVNHLSYFNLDYWSTQRCSKATINLNGWTSALTNHSVKIVISRPGGGFQRYKYGNLSQSSMTFYNIPTQFPLNFTVYYDNTVIGSLTTKCDLSTSTFSPSILNLSNIPNTRSVKVNAFYRYTDGTLNAAAGTSIRATINSISHNINTDSNGQATISTSSNQNELSYIINNRILNKYYKGTATIDENTNEVSITMDIPQLSSEYSIQSFELAHASMGTKTANDFEIYTLSPVFKIVMDKEVPSNILSFLDIKLTNKTNGASVNYSQASSALKIIQLDDQKTFYIQVLKSSSTTIAEKELKPGNTYTYTIAGINGLTMKDENQVAGISGEIKVRSITLTYYSSTTITKSQLNLNIFANKGLTNLSPSFIINSQYAFSTYNASSSHLGVIDKLNFTLTSTATTSINNYIIVSSTDGGTALTPSSTAIPITISNGSGMSFNNTFQLNIRSDSGLTVEKENGSSQVTSDDLPGTTTIDVGAK